MTKRQKVKQFFVDMDENNPAWLEAIYELHAATLYGNLADDWWEDGEPETAKHFGSLYWDAIKNGSTDGDIEREGWIK